MCGSADNPSRRALLGAAAALPLLGVGDIAPPPAPKRWTPDQVRGAERWARALEDYEAAEAEVEDAVGWPADYEEEYGERLDAECVALRRLLRTPAPDLHALALKIDLAIEHEPGTLAGGAACLAAIQADARRLAAAVNGDSYE